MALPTPSLFLSRLERAPTCSLLRIIQIEELKASNASLLEEVQRLKDEMSRSKVSGQDRGRWCLYRRLLCIECL